LPLEKSEFSPRVGLAYSINPKTVARSGYGIFWIPNYVSFSLNPLNDMVNGGATTYVGTVDGTHPVNTIALPFPAGISAPPGLSLGTAGTQQFLTQVVQSITEVNPRNHPEGYVQQWNLDLQRDLPAGFFVSAAYVGSKGTHLPQYSQQIDQISDALLAQAASQVDPSLPNPRQNVTLLQPVPNPFLISGQPLALTGPTTTVGQLLRPYPQFTSVQATETNGLGDYKALQARVERRMANGFTVQMAYAWSRAMTETGYLNDSDATLERVISPFDRAHTFVASGLVEVPYGRGRHYGTNASGTTNALLGGWQVGYIFKAQSGAPLGFGNFLFADGMGVGDIMAGEPSVDQWFNVNAFNRVSAQQLVSNVRTQPSRFEDVRGPGYAVLDLSLLKNVSLGGSRQLQFRVEAYNALNRANLQNPNTTTTSTALGTITAQNGLPRQLQLAVKVSF